jgi:hypothetical protein
VSDTAALPVRVYENRFTWWAQIDGTFCAGGALKIGDGRERAIRKAVGEYARAEARHRAKEARVATSEVEIRDAPNAW